MKRLFDLWTGLAAGLFVTLFLFVLAAVLFRVSPLELFGRLGDPVATDALVVSLKTSAIALTQAAVVLAVVLVASPFYLRQAISAFEGVDRNLLDASRTLGVGPFHTFRRVALPLAAGGLGAASTLAFARGLGEFGATIMFAGSLQGRTQTLPLMIYAQLGRDFEVALAVGALLVLVSLAVLLAAKVVVSWTGSGSIWPFRSAGSASS